MQVRVAYFRVFIRQYMELMASVQQLYVASLADAASVDTTHIRPSEPACSSGNNHHACEFHFSPRSFSQIRSSRHNPPLARSGDRWDRVAYVLCCFVITELENFGVTIHWFSISNQTLPLKTGFFVDQAHAVHVSLDTIINSGWSPYLF